MTAEGGSVATSGYWTSKELSQCGFASSLYCFGIDHSKALTKPSAVGRIAFVTEVSVPISATKGIAADDEECQNEAMAAALPGTYKAFLSQIGKTAGERFVADQRPWVRVDGVSLAEPGRSLLDATNLPPMGLLAPINVTASGAYVIGLVRTGGLGAGTVRATCNDWTDGSGRFFWGNADWTTLWWNWADDSCDAEMYVYCLQE
jgi:hypothetical protein